MHPALSLGCPVVECGDRYTGDVVDFFGREHFTSVGQRFCHRDSLWLQQMGPKHPLVVGWNDTTVSSHPHPAVHNFRPAINQPVDVEWHLLGRSTSSDADPNRLLDSVIQFIQLGQLVYRGEARTSLRLPRTVRSPTTLSHLNNIHCLTSTEHVTPTPLPYRSASLLVSPKFLHGTFAQGCENGCGAGDVRVSGGGV